MAYFWPFLSGWLGQLVRRVPTPVIGGSQGKNTSNSTNINQLCPPGSFKEGGWGLGTWPFVGGGSRVQICPLGMVEGSGDLEQETAVIPLPRSHLMHSRIQNWLLKEMLRVTLAQKRRSFHIS